MSPRHAILLLPVLFAALGGPAAARDVLLDAALARQVQGWDADVAAGSGSARCNAAFHRRPPGPADQDPETRLREAEAAGTLCRQDKDLLGYALVQAAAYADLFTRDLEPALAVRLVNGPLIDALELIGQDRVDPLLEASLTALATEFGVAARSSAEVDRLADAADARFRALGIDRSRSLALALANQGFARQSSGDIEGSRKSLERAEAMALALGTPDPVLFSAIYRRLATVHHRLGAYDRSLIYTDRALDVLPEGRQQAQRATLNYNKGGMLLVLGAYDGAIAAFTLAKNHYLRQGDEKPLAAALWSLGKAWHQKGLLTRALQLYLQAERIQTENKFAEDLMRTCLSLGILHENLSTPESEAEAVRYYDKAEALLLEAGEKSDNVHLRITLAINRGRLHEKAGRYEKAEGDYRTGVALNQLDVTARPSWIPDSNLAWVLQQLGKHKQALLHARRAIELLDATIQTGFFVQGAAHLGFIERSRAAFDIAREASLALGDVPGALAMHETGRDRVRQVMFQLRQAVQGDDASKRKWQQRSEIDRELANLHQRAAQSPSEQERTTLTVRRRALEAERTRVETSLFQRPDLFGKLFRPRVFDLEALQAELDPDEALIDYQFTAWALKEPRLTIRAFVIRRGSMHAINLYDGPEIGQVTGLLAEYLELLTPQALLRHQSEGHLDQLTQQLDSGAGRLYSLLFARVEPALQGVQRLTILPSGSLNLLPFEALKDAQGRFLVERFVVGYGTSLNDARRGPERPAGPALLVGDIVYGARREDLRFWPAIAGSAEVLDELSRSLARRTAVARLQGADATEVRFTTKAPGHRWLVLWTHGKFDDQRQTPAALKPATDPEGNFSITTPEELEAYTRYEQLRQFEDPLADAFVVLAGVNQGGDDANDGYLTAREVMNLDLDSVDLTVLAACETGVGQASSSEGLIGLRWAFALAGSRQLLMSLWQVDAGWTGRLLGAFFEHQPEAGGAWALQQAKIRLIRQLRQEGLEPYPFYWAGFVLSGR